FDPASVWLNSAVLPYGAADADMVGTFWATAAADYLCQPPSGPFFVYVSFWETHSPFPFPVEFRGRHVAEEFTARQVTDADRERLPAVFRPLTPADKAGIQAAYHTCAAFMDKNVGVILDGLQSSGRAADTVVLFTSDHGYLLGQ